MDVSRSDGSHGCTQRVDALIVLLQHSDERNYIGEPVSQLAHALQSAHFARLNGGASAEIVAALLHDIGHICERPPGCLSSELGVTDHDSVGAQYLRAIGFDDDVTDVVGAHVAAKRYLSWKNAAYLDQLSAASRKTLELQGGPMSREQAIAFQQRKRLRAILRVRRWDELGKQPGLTVAGLGAYRSLMLSYLATCREA